MDDIIGKIKEAAKEIEPELIRIRRKLHQYPELGMKVEKTHEIIYNELKNIPNLELVENAAGGAGIIGVMRGSSEKGRTVLLRADIDALPIEEKSDVEYASKNPGCMHACGHDGHATWLIGAAMILSKIRKEWSGCVKFVFQPGEEVGQGADLLVYEDKVLENPKVDMAFAAHGWPSIESGEIGIARRYAFGCVGGFQIQINGRGGHASWPEKVIDPITVANEIYQHIPSILTKKISGVESKVLSVTYMQAGDSKIRNIIPESCIFGGTMRTSKREVMEQMAEELEKEVKSVCQVYGASYDANIQIHGDGVENDGVLVEEVKKISSEIIGKKKAFIIEENNLGGENFVEFSSRVPSVYFFVGIKPQGQLDAPGLHSPDFAFDDSVLADTSAVFSALAYYGCKGEMRGQEKKWKR